jgi:hypothetical protein
MVYTGSQVDIASIITPPAGNNPEYLPLVSSIGLVIFDRDTYLAQHASLQQNSSPSLGNTPPDPFTDTDLNYSLAGITTSVNPPVGSTIAQDKFIEENWIDKNGTALMISPFNGSLIKAK